MNKILFIDRDGTIIKEHYPSYQIDSIEKIFFLPRVIFFLSKISKELQYKLVMVSNQDGLGTKKFPESCFWPIHNHIINVLKSENICFSSVHIDKTYKNENSVNRKPNIGMLYSYLENKNYDISKSFVIGDRITDMLLAKNLKCKFIWIRDNFDFNKFTKEEREICKNQNALKNYEKIISLKTNDWKKIYQYLSNIDKKNIFIKRITSETEVKTSIIIYGSGRNKIKTGLGFFDHLLKQISIHGQIDININAKGDYHVDEHHTIEDVGIVLGKAFNKSLGEKKGIERYGFYILPMDDCLSKVALDFGGRESLLWKVKFYRENIGKIPTEMFHHFFKSFSSHAKCNIHIKATGKNEHHKIESIFKCFAKSIKMAIKKTCNNIIFSSKGKILE